MTRRLSFHYLLLWGVGDGATPFPWFFHFTLDPHLIVLSKVTSNIILWVFGMNRFGIEPRSLGTLVNTLLIRPMARLYIWYYNILRKNYIPEYTSLKWTIDMCICYIFIFNTMLDKSSTDTRLVLFKIHGGILASPIRWDIGWLGLMAYQSFKVI